MKKWKYFLILRWRTAGILILALGFFGIIGMDLLELDATWQVAWGIGSLLTLVSYVCWYHGWWPFQHRRPHR
jgi:hypothetical protein